MSSQSKNNTNLREQVDKYLIKWKWFLFSLIIFIALAFVYLRYSTDTYKIAATIKIADSKEQNGAFLQLGTGFQSGFSAPSAQVPNAQAPPLHRSIHSPLVPTPPVPSLN